MLSPRAEKESRDAALQTELPDPSDPRLTPMLRQYVAARAQYPDAVLFFRMGDFYELFYDHAVLASEVLGLTLTTRDKAKDAPIPMAGVPHHASIGYIRRLVEAGHKVAVCEQVEDPRKAKGIVRREVTRVVTPGLVVDPESLDESSNNYLLAVAPRPKGVGVAWIDVSTGEFRCAEVEDFRAVADELARVAPREVLLPPGLEGELGLRPELSRTVLLEDAFDVEQGRGDLCATLGVSSLAGFGVESDAMVSASGAVLWYMRKNHSAAMGHVTALRPYSPQRFMGLDESTRRNLELFKTLVEGRRKGSVLGLLDRCRTAMGSRMLRAWLSRPLLEVEEIEARHDAVGFLGHERAACEDLRDDLRSVADIERLNAKVSCGSATPRDLVALRGSLSQVPMLNMRLEHAGADPDGLLSALPVFDELVEDLALALVDEPPAKTADGGYIKEGFCDELDELIRLSRDGRSSLASLERREREATGIGSLKVRYNQVFGYYIEVTKANLSAVPEHYIRKQTLANSERYFTPELKTFEEKVLGADDRRKVLEWELFLGVRQQVADAGRTLSELAGRIASLDVLCALSDVAVRYDYCRPELDNSTVIELTACRHPVVERMGLSEPFVANDIRLASDSRSVLMLTGPNMAGKSTVMRQVALACLLAQIGSFVPADKARLGICDRVFTRVGASDDLARGQSTFMVEMSETANILHNATQRSLVIMDEIGRGTSTYDGLSIAWAVAEDLHDRLRCRALFATHYHELVALAASKSRMANLSITVAEWGDRVVFLRKLKEGGASRSYGIQVARLAGLPGGVLDRAKEVLANLEREAEDAYGAPRIARSKSMRGQRSGQLSLFAPPQDLLREALDALDPNALTPLEALVALAELKAKVEEG